jgi:demethylmenaquinone methyltransferase/2-methoxy-6-polyprenyl-1,4-benzoquinol methylase
MLAINRGRVVGRPVEFVHADIFEWQPDKTYDVVFFAFWLSHVPYARLEAFWQIVMNSLGPTGRVFFVDEGKHKHWTENLVDPTIPLVRRTLEDGSEHLVVKTLWDPEELEERIIALGWDLKVEQAGPFYFGYGKPAEQH